MTQQETTENIGNSPQKAGPRVMIRVDESAMSTHYANAFRTFPTTEELTLDFGLNMMTQLPPDATGADGAMQLTINDRVIMNYQMAKRLAISLGNVIRAHEEKFGEIKLQLPE
ncbi:MAG: DUF3467 domain-containing protein [Chlorobiaceae bacterium]|nr:DUF3467 domain-containing protein [Chlorobiaceae bacterium]